LGRGFNFKQDNLNITNDMNKDTKHHFAVEAINYATGKPVRVEIAGEIISEITEIDELKNKKLNLFVSPGLIDNQINGYAGVDFSGNSFQAEDLLRAVQSIWKDGVTTFLPTLITNSDENLKRNLRVLSTALKEDKNLKDSIPGFHLEGPYISPDDGYRGCHPLQYIRKPSWKEYLDYQEAAGGKIVEITIAPEIEGAIDFIGKIAREGIIVALGHTNASSEQIIKAVENGAKLSTHLVNGCANFIHRHKNPIWQQLANDQLTPTIIGDGLHLSAEEVQVIYKVKGPGNMILISDVIYLIGMAPGIYTFLESDVVLGEDGMLFNPDLNCMAGASFPLKKGVENMMNFTGCSLTKAIDMASLNVAGVLNLKDRGRLESGRRADLILFSRDGNRLDIHKTFLNGRLVYSDDL